MKTIQLIITKNRKPREIIKTLRQRKLQRGDTLRFKSKENDQKFASAFIFWLLIVVWYFSEKNKKKKSFGDEVADLMFDKNISSEILEKQIEKEYGVKVEVEQKGGEEKLWRDFSAQNFLKGYASNEPEYSLSDVKEPNPEYKKWKKAK